MDLGSGYFEIHGDLRSGQVTEVVMGARARLADFDPLIRAKAAVVAAICPDEPTVRLPVRQPGINLEAIGRYVQEHASPTQQAWFGAP